MSPVRRGALGAAASLLLLAGSAGAQGAGAPVREVTLGSRVRVKAPSLRSDRYVGRIDSLDASAMVLDTTGARRRLGMDTGPVLVDEYRYVRIPLSSVTTMDVSTGRTSRGSTIRGAIIGGVAGALLIGLGQLPEINPGFKDFLKAAPTGLAIGAVVGGAVGFALGGERWAPAAIPR